MAAIDAILTDSMSSMIDDWFEPTLDHPFLNIEVMAVPDTVKSIPRRWTDEVQIDGGCFGEEGGDFLGELGGGKSWSYADGQQRLHDALARLELPEDRVAHANLERMGKQELSNEKRRVKQELKRYDADFRKQFDRNPCHSEKEAMRPLYVYYRKLKTMISHAEQPNRQRRGSEGQISGQRFGRTSLATIPDLDEAPGPRASVEDKISALEVRIDELQAEKSVVRSKLQDFQERFVAENNRKIRFHKDILPIEREYRSYKLLKEEIQKIEQQLKDIRANEP